jgi:hypothetical protein
LPQKAFFASPILEPLCRITDLWLDPQSAIRRKAVQALQVSTGYPPRMIERAIQNAFEALSRDNLTEFIRSESIYFDSRSQAIVLHIGAGNVFTAWLHGAVISLLLGHRCWIKPSSSEPVFAHLWRESIRMIDIPLAERISVVPWTDDLLQKVEAVVAYGTDETLEQLRLKADPAAVFVGFGHKISAAVAFNEAVQPDQWSLWHDRAIADGELFQLNGCLSPQVLYVEGTDLGPWKSLSESLRPAPELCLFEDLDSLTRELRCFQGRLSTLGIAGRMARVEPFRTLLESFGITRICELGQMQRPSLTWRNGEISLPQALRSL